LLSQPTSTWEQTELPHLPPHFGVATILLRNRISATASPHEVALDLSVEAAVKSVSQLIERED